MGFFRGLNGSVRDASVRRVFAGQISRQKIPRLIPQISGGGSLC